ncbi:DUF971 domain-containing protein [Pseudoalteromonas sp. McH1-7]|uniref:Gamma-butyrobetaine hydroxylase-like N-terminal domain-containing protein n=1 Tax=Pseudoalteromonas peptidolytica F12-50-A1 TaxID=1315280 RepID=A0A8I0T576_9GAMM|nr:MULTISPECIES: gamma-butyrobetaine hydroxylase-like domain-containing protein [Pseudoalteromonas]MBE0347087.1 hypothetical protein [Pseudoalteromonas peptidolytica F12-50-A1]MDW7549234.1 gamma-butyrobetaine hydroxylase-like domain-containing protein [Pseudoalteromonas peptidolytica]NLR15988.1 DUF971 domain-containing protein [Pseudoalteromonas peptidolytica]NUZ10553.1 DUF971 domain-containing protein [Pseudoalteromonas sp. McH1-7]USD28897.1 DUF971 domain-containing protein [Pseudoalteromonas
MYQVTKLHYHTLSKVLDVYFEDGSYYCLKAEYLRTHSPSAEVQGHTPAQKQLVLNKQSVSIKAIEPIGHYAARLIFDDGHESGLFSWQYLHTIATQHDKLWQEYLDAVEKHHAKKDSVPIKFVP